MRVSRLAIPDVALIEPQLFVDARGSFFESFNRREYEVALGRSIEFVQDNQSHSTKGVLRGLHLQTAPRAQAFHRALRPRRRQRRQQQNLAVLRLNQHFDDGCRRAEIAFDLERRMRVEQVRVGAARVVDLAAGAALLSGARARLREQAAQHPVRPLALQEPRPERHLPSH